MHTSIAKRPRLSRMLAFMLVSCLLLVVALCQTPAFSAPSQNEDPDTYQVQAKPRVLILATGGTIAGKGDGISAVSYSAGKASISDVMKTVPQARNIAELKYEQVANIPSQDISFEIWKNLAERINKAFDNNECDGVVITHGTDTVEETAFFLRQVLKSDKPVVLVCSMRPPTALSPDGPRNLYDAIAVAASPEAQGRGVMVCLNNRVYNARTVTKCRTSGLDSFMATLGGPIGLVEDEVFFDAEKRPYPLPRFDITKIKSLPRVDVIYACADMSPDVIKASVDSGAKGLVLAGVGDGNASQGVLNALREAAEKGIPVVRASRVVAGLTYRDAEVMDAFYGFSASADLNPPKARVLLQLLLSQGITDAARIQKEFYIR